MNAEQLERGQILQNEVSKLKKQIYFWEKSKGVKDTIQLDVDCFERWVNVDTTFVNFEVLKTLTLSELKKKLNEKETEFKNL